MSIKPSNNSLKALARFGMISTMTALNPTNISLMAPTIALAPSSPVAASKDKPDVIREIPIAIDIQERLSKAIEPLNDNIVKVSGFNKVAATPMIANIAAMTPRPFIKDMKSILWSNKKALAKLVIIASIPVPVTARPAPKAINEAPRVVIEPLRAKIDGIMGFNAETAIPRIVNVPANPAKLAATPTIPRPPIEESAALITNKAAEAANNVAEAPPTFRIDCRDFESISMAPPAPTRPFTTSFQDNDPSFSIAFPKTSKDEVTAGRAPLTSNKLSVGSPLAANVTAASEPAIATNPLATSSQESCPRSFRTEEKTVNEAPINAIETEAVIIPLELPIFFVMAINSINNPPIAARPFPISSQSMLAKVEKVVSRILIAPAKTTILAAVAIDFTEKFALLINNPIAVSNPETPKIPFANDSQLRDDRSIHADAIILIAVANKTTLVAPFSIVPPPLERTFETVTMIAANPATPSIPVCN